MPRNGRSYTSRICNFSSAYNLGAANCSCFWENYTMRKCIQAARVWLKTAHHRDVRYLPKRTEVILPIVLTRSWFIRPLRYTIDAVGSHSLDARRCCPESRFQQMKHLKRHSS